MPKAPPWPPSDHGGLESGTLGKKKRRPLSPETASDRHRAREIPGNPREFPARQAGAGGLSLARMTRAPDPSEDPNATATGAFEPTRRQWTGFWCMIVQQTQNAFNDKMAQFMLIPVAAAVGFAVPIGVWELDVESAAGLIIALPFVLFAPLAGWLSDRFSKRDVMLGMAVAQVCILGWICAGVWMKNLPMALAGFFALAVQSTFYSPAKIGINKELVGSRRLGFAAGIQQMTAMLAILMGQVVAGWWFDRRFIALGGTPDVAGQAAFAPLGLLAVFAVPAVALAWVVPRVPAQGREPFTRGMAVSHFRDLRVLWRDAGLRRGSFGIAFFWGFAAFLNLWSVKVAREITGGGPGFGTLSSNYMAAAAVGMVLGFGAAALLLRRGIELGWVPVAGAVMAAGSAALAFADPGSRWFPAGLGGLAFAGAVFLAPLLAWMQDHYPADRRGVLTAAVNLQSCLAGIVSVLVIMLLEMIAGAFGLATLPGLRGQLLVLALACAAITALVIRLLPRDFARLVFLAMVRSFYRIRVAHPERVPASGGALLLPNHVTFADAFFLSAACRRPLRFVMDETFMAKGWIRLSARIFGTVPIRREQPLDAIRAVIGALRKGEVVCMFPEGQLTRTGGLSELRRGFEVIARKAGHPLIPVWCDGAWGSVFSFERNRFFRKLPYRVPYGLVVAFGRPLEPRGVDRAKVREAMWRASADALARRFSPPGRGMRLPPAARLGPAADAVARYNRFERRRVRINAHQISQVNGLRWRETIHMLADDAVARTLAPLAAFPALHGGRLRIHDSMPRKPEGAWVGGAVTRERLARAGDAAGARFFDFESPGGGEPPNCGGAAHFPCLAVGGVVVAMSMPHPPKSNERNEFQPGHKTGSCGKLLPGWSWPPDDGGKPRVRGPAARSGGLELPRGSRVDADGFVFIDTAAS